MEAVTSCSETADILGGHFLTIVVTGPDPSRAFIYLSFVLTTMQSDGREFPQMRKLTLKDAESFPQDCHGASRLGNSKRPVCPLQKTILYQ